jgi:hypothetical protein
MYVALAVALVGMTACGNRNNRTKVIEEEVVTLTAPQPADCDPDEGYVWSRMNENCVKLFEEGVSLISVEKPELDRVIYVLFSPDSTRAELFIDQQSTDILDRQIVDGQPVWGLGENSAKSVQQVDGAWVMKQEGKIAYTHTADLGPIEARYLGSDGITRRVYWVDASFYPEADRATVKVDDRVYELKQYVTGSGYGYRNADADLRGKGYEAQLTFTSDTLRNLTLKDTRADE